MEITLQGLFISTNDHQDLGRFLEKLGIKEVTPALWRAEMFLLLQGATVEQEKGHNTLLSALLLSAPESKKKLL